MDGEPCLDIVGNAAFETGAGRLKDIDAQARDLARIAGVSLTGLRKPERSRLTEIRAEGQTVYTPGSALAITVTAFYDSGYSRQVSAFQLDTPANLQEPGSKTITVTYTENGVEATTKFEIVVTEDRYKAILPVVMILAAAALLAAVIIRAKKRRPSVEGRG